MTAFKAAVLDAQEGGNTYPECAALTATADKPEGLTRTRIDQIIREERQRRGCWTPRPRPGKTRHKK